MDLELWKDEKFIAKDELWLRVARHLDPSVRRDMVGWMKGVDHAPKIDRSSSFRSILLDYVRGAAQVIDPFPKAPRLPSKSDREALIEDAQKIAGDCANVVALVRLLVDQQKRGDDGRGRRERKAVQAAG